MPRRANRRGRRLTFGQESFLINGGLFGDGLAAFNGDLEAARRAWEQNRERLLREHRQPLNRPNAWWWWDAPPWEHLLPVPEEPAPPRLLHSRPYTAGGPRPVPIYNPEEILAQLGELDDLELAELARWRAIRREPQDSLNGNTNLEDDPA